MGGSEYPAVETGTTFCKTGQKEDPVKRKRQDVSKR